MRPAPIGGLKAPLAMRLKDPESERLHRDLSGHIVELQQLPAASLRVIRGVLLKDATATHVSHGLGREPVFILPSIPYGANAPGSGGFFYETRGKADRKKTLVLTATGFATDITVDLMVL